jgi:protein gp37/ParB-like chromosome segregation protein Spo0J
MTTISGYRVHKLADLFPTLSEEELEDLAKDIKTNGLHDSITLDHAGRVLIDGRNRLRACGKAQVEPKFERLPASYTEEKINKLIISKNIQRRNLTTDQKAALALLSGEFERLEAEAKQRQRDSGGDRKSNARSVAPKSAGPISEVRDQLAAMFSVGHGKISDARKIYEEDEDLLYQVLRDDRSLDDLLEELPRERERPTKQRKSKKPSTIITLLTHEGREVRYPKPGAKVKFNETNDQVSWAYWTWNPVTGCLHGCKYCYAREMAVSKRYKKTYPVGFTPLFHHERLNAPVDTDVPQDVATDERKKRVFVCSMADLYGKWVPDDWIKQVHQRCIDNPQWDYLMLTKFPRRYVGMDLPRTAWLGTSVDEQKRVRLAEEAFRQIRDVRVKWLSLEPLLAPLQFSDLSMFDWMVIGSQSGTRQPGGWVPEFAPPFEWVARLVAQAKECGCKVYMKPNLLGNVNSQSAGMKLIQEAPL